MSKRVVATIIILSTSFLSFPLIVGAIDFNFVGKIKDIVGYIKTTKNMASGNNLSEDVPHTFNFGGHITHSEGGCAVKAWTWIIVLGFPVPCPNCLTIPLGGNTIEVGDPISSPKGQMFTFPFISDIYANHNEGKTGPWALGIGFTPFPIDKINDALGKIPKIPFGVGWIDHFHLECSDSNKNVILKMGTSQ